MTDLLTRLKYWDEVYPEDIDKPEGSLYEEAHDALHKATKHLRRIDSWADENFYIKPDVFDGLKDLLKELQGD